MTGLGELWNLNQPTGGNYPEQIKALVMERVMPGGFNQSNRRA